jgi:hypothetical protein
MPDVGSKVKFFGERRKYLSQRRPPERTFSVRAGKGAVFPYFVFKGAKV